MKLRRRNSDHMQTTAEWTAQQLREAFPFDQLPRYLLRDRDGILGSEFRRDGKAMGIQEVLSTPRLALGTCVGGTRHRHDPERVPGSRDRLPPSPTSPAREIFPSVRSRIPYAPLA